MRLLFVVLVYFEGITIESIQTVLRSNPNNAFFILVDTADTVLRQAIIYGIADESGLTKHIDDEAP